MKKIFLLIAALSASLAAEARLTAFGDPAYYGIKPYGGNDPVAVNPYTWDVFLSMDADKMFGLDADHYTLASVEYHSTYVQEGMKTGQNSFLLSIADRGAFFGGDGYFELAAEFPTAARYAQQYYFLGGWKYNINEFLHIDVGGNFKYATKRISGPGLPGAGVRFTGDIYIGLILNVPTNPFVYYMYNPDYDAQKIMAGVNPQFSLEKIFGIKHLYFDMEAYYGYVNANRWTGDDEVGGRYWKNTYSFVQAEAAFVYRLKSWRFTIGGGYSYHNDKPVAGISCGPSQNAWVSTSIGYVF